MHEPSPCDHRTFLDDAVRDAERERRGRTEGRAVGCVRLTERVELRADPGERGESAGLRRGRPVEHRETHLLARRDRAEREVEHGAAIVGPDVLERAPRPEIRQWDAGSTWLNPLSVASSRRGWLPAIVTNSSNSVGGTSQSIARR